MDFFPLYEGLKQLEQAIISEISLLSSLEYRGVRSEEALPGRAECLGMGVVESVLFCWRYHALPSASPNRVRDSLAMPLESVCGLCAGNLYLFRSTMASMYHTVIHFHREQRDWSIVECAFRRSWTTFHGKTITLKPLFHPVTFQRWTKICKH